MGDDHLRTLTLGFLIQADEQRTLWAAQTAVRFLDIDPNSDAAEEMVRRLMREADDAREEVQRDVQRRCGVS